MNPTTKATFALENYKVLKFTFDAPNIDLDLLNVGFDPKGEFSEENQSYVLVFSFKAMYGEKQEVLLEATMLATFKFGKKITSAEIPDYFYRNSIAIVFPYLRAFVSTITAVANVKPLILPVMNLSKLDQLLRDNTTGLI